MGNGKGTMEDMVIAILKIYFVVIIFTEIIYEKIRVIKCNVSCFD